MTWTPEQTEFAIKHWRDGKSAATVAEMMNAAFGTKLSRNAVIGRLNRLGHQRAAPALSVKTGRRSNYLAFVEKGRAAMAKKRAEAKAVKWQAQDITKVEKPKPTPAPVIIADVSFARPWMERGSGQCAYPLGERYAVISCCAPTAETYCKAHRAMMGGTRHPWSPKDHRKAARA